MTSAGSTGNPRWDELIEAAIEARLTEVHTSIPGIVKKFYANKGTCDVQPAVNRVEERLNGERISKPFPKIFNVPIIYPSGGGYILRWPLNPGDVVELRFSEKDTALFRSTGQQSDPQNLRKHDISYPTAWPCEMRLAQAQAIPTEIADAMQIDGPNGLVVGKPLIALPVAIAELVEAAIAAAIAGHTHTGGTISGATGVGVPAAPVLPTAAANLKAEPDLPGP